MNLETNMVTGASVRDDYLGHSMLGVNFVV